MAVKRDYEKCLQAMAGHPDHPLWPSLVLMAYARLGKQARERPHATEDEPAGLAFFMAVPRRAFEERDAVKVATVTGTLAEPMRRHVVTFVVGEVRRVIPDLLTDAPGDTLAVVLAPVR